MDDDIGQLKTATGRESGGGTVRVQEKLGYAYDSAGNLNWRTNNALLQDFGVNTLNELTTISRQGNMTVAGGVSATPTTVTVKDNSNPAQAASAYGDNAFPREDVSSLDGSALSPTSNPERCLTVWR